MRIIGWVTAVLLVGVVSAFTQNLQVKVIDRRDSDDGYEYSGVFNDTSPVTDGKFTRLRVEQITSSLSPLLQLFIQCMLVT
jgi:hypothetical protein